MAGPGVTLSPGLEAKVSLGPLGKDPIYTVHSRHTSLNVLIGIRVRPRGQREDPETRTVISGGDSFLIFI